MRRALATVIGALALLLAAPASAGSGPRVASINLCTDQLLLSLADPEQIAGLSPFARDPQRSGAAAAAAAFPLLSGTAEDVLALRPDLVLAGRYTKRATRELLKLHGLRVVEFDPVRSVAEAKAQLRQVASLLGHPDRAEPAVARIAAAEARARAAWAGRSLSVLPVMRRGWVSGRDTLLASLLATAGLANAGDRLARPAGSFVPMEAIVAAKPDRILVVEEGRPPDDQGSALLHHAALEGLFPPAGRLTLPDRLIACGGPTTADALDALAREAPRTGS